MKRFVNPMLATALCALALSTTTAPKAHAAQSQPKVLAQATADAKPFVISWLDDTTGAHLQSQDFTAMFASSAWTIMDTGISIKSKDGSFALTVGTYAANQSLTLILPHARAQNLSVDGEIKRDSQDPTKGQALLFFTQPALDNNNKVIGLQTLVVDTPLTFTPTPTNP